MLPRSVKSWDVRREPAHMAIQNWSGRHDIGAQNTPDLKKVRQADTASQEVQQADTIQDLSRSYFCTIPRATIQASNGPNNGKSVASLKIRHTQA